MARTSNLKTNNIYLFSGFLGILIVIGFLFYWQEVRPAQIKSSCSWVKKTSPLQPAIQPMSEIQLREKGILEDCSKWDFTNNIETPRPLTLIGKDYCESENLKKIEEYRHGKASVPAKEWWAQSNEEEYKFCLHDKGL